MNHRPIIRRGVPGRGRSMMLALAATLAVALPAAAQDATESPSPTSDPAGIAFPVMLGGQLLTPTTYSGAEWLARFSDGDSADPAFVAGTEALVESVGASVDDLTIKSALYEPASVETDVVDLLEELASPPPTEAVVVTEPAVVLAMRIDGTDAREWVELAVDVMVGDVIEPGLLMRPLDTKWTLRVTDAAMPGVYPRTVYLKDDTAWIIQGDDEYVWDALGQLPDADPVGLSSADSLYTDMPIVLDDERRVGLYETTEPLFLPTLGERLGDAIEDWLLDLYLEAGISPAEMIGVITWWGLEASGDGLQIEGYRLPEGGEELTQRLLEDIFLIRPPEVSIDPNAPDAPPIDEVAAALAGVEFLEQEIAGQPVTTLDYGGSTQHIFSTADTIWVISDPLGERDKVEEAIATLP